MSVYFSNECPVGCGALTFVQSKLDDSIFCYCTGCGVGFDHPREAKIDSKLNISKTLANFAPKGIRLPTKTAIEKAGLWGWVTDIATENEWHSEQDINEYLHR